jgi:hypothetical protein
MVARVAAKLAAAETMHIPKIRHPGTGYGMCVSVGTVSTDFPRILCQSRSPPAIDMTATTAQPTPKDTKSGLESLPT